ncbi:hypothetical protein NEF87_000511 [Candidatus Lokiarchaeum ossiferum]|uniref:Uncharacterized protein n=1 Tax=Candidatus Lokiarchaeum ossiferum TaxID=2951803 RepID=A0ABY6HLD1_9ARCH|nr:hypothetical protein NEF87_000511 [Candidatus Lokiarchaeum sp. B-35]
MENDQEKENKDLKSKEGLNDFFSDLGDDDAIDSDYDEIDQMIDEVMALLENYGNYSGGLITLETIFNFLKERNYPDIEQEDCFEIISRLRTNQVIRDEILYNDLPGFFLYVFKDITITLNGKNLIRLFVQTSPLSLSTIQMKWKNEPDLLLTTLTELQNQKILVVEKELYSIPALTLKN